MEYKMEKESILSGVRRFLGDLFKNNEVENTDLEEKVKEIEKQQNNEAIGLLEKRLNPSKSGKKVKSTKMKPQQYSNSNKKIYPENSRISINKNKDREIGD